jgi:hypothetical protein
MPDGEPGGRWLWTQWQVPVLRATPCFRRVNPELGPLPGPLTLADGVSSDDVHFGELGYLREARASYQDFLDARERAEPPAAIRFQVSLPTHMPSSWVDASSHRSQSRFSRPMRTRCSTRSTAFVTGSRIVT